MSYGGTSMNRREFCLAGGALAAWPLSARAGQTKRLPVVGLLFVNTVDQERELFGDDPFGFRDLGYIEGETIAFERRYADGNSDLLAKQAQEFVALKVDIIVTGGPGVFAAFRLTKDIPIVVGSLGDPVGQGFAASLAHPGGNVTGSAIFGPQVLAKRLEVLKQVVPSLKRAGVLLFQGYGGNPRFLEVMTPVAKALNVELSPIEVMGPNGYAEAFSAVSKTSIDGMVFTEPAQLLGNAALIASLAIARGLPAIGSPPQATAGALIGYGVDLRNLFHNAALFADKILKGAKPGDIPFEQATKFETIVNLNTARALGLAVPTELLAQATRVIE